MATSFDEFRPFDSGAGSNVLEAGWRRMARLWLPDGIAAARANLLAVTESSPTAMSVKVDTGEVWIQGHHGEITAAKTLPIAAAHATLARKDLVVARADFTDNVVELDVLTGTPHASPSEPTLTQNTAMWEIDLALVDVPAADTAIGNAQITDRRDFTAYNSASYSIAQVLVDVAADIAVVQADADLAGPDRPRCNAFRAASKNVTSGTTYAIEFDTEDYDTDGFHSLVTNTERLTIPTGLGGAYSVKGGTAYTGAGTTGGCFIGFRVNGGASIWRNSIPHLASFSTFASFACDVTLAAGDYIECIMQQTSGGARADVTGYLQIARIGWT